MEDREINNGFLATIVESESDIEEEGAQESATDASSEEESRPRNDCESMTAFENALELFTFKGFFVRTETYVMSRAANPCLEIEGMGCVGLPLSPSVAASIAANNGFSEPCPIVEIAAEKISFQNPEWDAWLQKEVGLVCSELAGQKVEPSYRLRNLILESPASDLSFRELLSGDVGTVVIYLPSLFTGGDLECSHGVQSTTIDFSPQSQLHTSVLTAYSGVQVVQGAITSGYRLALTYDIVQPDGRARAIPSFPDMQSAASALEQAMKKWRQGDSGEPEPAACFLQRQYDTAHFDAESLEGSDEILVSHLIRLAEELDFQLYLVKLEFCQSLVGDYEDQGEYEPDPPKIDPRRIKELTGTGFENFKEYAIDAHGISVHISGFDFKEDRYLNGELTDVTPDCAYELLNFGLEIQVDEEYHRTLFILWPTARGPSLGLQVRYSEDYAISALQASDSIVPSGRENVLVDTLREEAENDSDEATRVLCKCACQWSDLSLLLTIWESHGVAANLGLVGLDNCNRAYRTFGWGALRDLCDIIQFCGAMRGYWQSRFVWPCLG
ncbi:hypothetical protein K438DRAFT_964594 [Mycena galopus ATCC 62051]|nr:hypothetical protein K438DRAFT_964594 [Mycena galopus ATCC 62051]